MPLTEVSNLREGGILGAVINLGLDEVSRILVGHLKL